MPADAWTRWPTVWLLVAANLVPLAGVLWWGWSLAEVLLLYWMESAIIGGFTILKMILSRSLAAFALVPFFCFHFGMFMMVHLFFLAFFVLGGLFGGDSRDVLGDLARTVVNLVPAVLALIASHGLSFAYFFRSERPSGLVALQKAMFEPYPRIVVMQVTIIVGAFLYFGTGSRWWFLGLIIVLKVGADILGHLRQHRARASGPTTPFTRAAP